MSDDANIDAYFERIGFAGSIAPTLETLGQLQALHAAAIPFENIDPIMGSPIRLELRNLEQKLLFEKRGGYCFEQNLLMKAMLEDLGFGVRAVAARVNWNHASEAERPLSHMALTVDVNGTDYLVDVGFGAVNPTGPLRLRADTEQATPHEPFRLVGGEPDWRLQVKLGEEWRSVYTFDLTERSFDEFVSLNDELQAQSGFRDRLIAARHEKGRRITLTNRELKIRPVGGETETRTLAGVLDTKDVLANMFGIALPSAERLDPALERVFSQSEA